jgi:hypothetical protein
MIKNGKIICDMCGETDTSTGPTTPYIVIVFRQHLGDLCPKCEERRKANEKGISNN